MKIRIKDNNVLQYSEPLQLVDIEMDVDGVEKRHVYLGENGVGKTFDFRMFVNAAYLYSITDHSPNSDYDTQKVIQNMIDVGVGSKSKTSPSNHYFLVKHFTSLRLENEQKETDSQSVGDDVSNAILTAAKLMKKLDSYYYLKIGKQAREFFDRYNVIYYSNSQFPTNDTFFSERVSSFQTKDVDIGFWIIFRNLFERSNFKIRFWKNNSMTPLRTNVKKSFNEFISLINSESFLSDFRYKHRNILNYLNIDLLKVVERSSILYGIEKIFNAENHPGYDVSLQNISIFDYVTLIICSEADKTINYELYYTDDGRTYPLSKMNSGKRYLLTLKCLKSVYKESIRRTLIVVDEPENSLHLKSIDEIVKSEKEGCIFWVATHSPAYAMSIINNDDEEEKAVLHVVSKPNGRLQEEICGGNLLPSLSLDNIAAEYFAYSPFMEKFNRENVNIDDKHMIGINDFYEKFKELKD